MLALPRVEKQHGPIYRAFDRFFASLDALYVRLLGAPPTACGWCWPPWRWWLERLLLRQRRQAFAPGRRRGRFLVSLRTPLGSSIDYTDAKLREVEAILDPPGDPPEFSLIGLGAAGR